MSETTTRPTSEILKDALAALPEKTYLIYIDRNDELSDEQCAQLIGGKKDEIYNDSEWFFDATDNGIDSVLEDAVKDVEERQALRESDDFDTFREAVQERDNSTPIGDLIHNTGKKLVRFYIRTSKGERVAIEPDSWRWDEARTEREARKLCRLARLDWLSNRKHFIELVANATGGGVLCIYAYVDLSDIDKIVEHCLRDPDRGRVAITFTNPHVLIHDFINGSGHDVQVEGEITVRFGSGALDMTHGIMALDAKGIGGGYSWEETCGPHAPAYATPMKVKTYKGDKGIKPDHPAPERWPGM